MKMRLNGKVSPDAFKALIDIIENVRQTLPELSLKLKSSPAASCHNVALGATLIALLQDDLLPDPSQRLVAIYILYDVIVGAHNSTSQVQNSAAIDRLLDSPLTIALFELFDALNARPPEQLFLSILLGNVHSTTGEISISPQILQEPAISLWKSLEKAMHSGASVPKSNITLWKRKWNERHPETLDSQSILLPVSGIVTDPDYYSSVDSGPLSDELSSVVTLEDFAPNFVRPPPPFLAITTENDELRWIDPEPLHEIVWDPEMGMKGERGSELREIITRALRTPIPEAKQMQVLAQLEADPKLVHHCGITPEKLPDLVQNNRLLAIEILLKLASSNQMQHYFSAFVNMEMNLNSMEVLTRLADGVRLPTEFLRAYISNCISSCREISDRYGRIRMVRVVCVFLQNLIRNKIIDVQDVSGEVQSFCIEYSRIREVADLFRMLKTNGVQQ